MFKVIKKKSIFKNDRVIRMSQWFMPFENLPKQLKRILWFILVSQKRSATEPSSLRSLSVNTRRYRDFDRSISSIMDKSFCFPFLVTWEPTPHVTKLVSCLVEYSWRQEQKFNNKCSPAEHGEERNVMTVKVVFQWKSLNNNGQNQWASKKELTGSGT